MIGLYGSRNVAFIDLYRAIYGNDRVYTEKALGLTKGENGVMTTLMRWFRYLWVLIRKGVFSHFSRPCRIE